MITIYNLYEYVLFAEHVFVILMIQPITKFCHDSTHIVKPHHLPVTTYIIHKIHIICGNISNTMYTYIIILYKFIFLPPSIFRYLSVDYSVLVVLKQTQQSYFSMNCCWWSILYSPITGSNPKTPCSWVLG